MWNKSLACIGCETSLPKCSCEILTHFLVPMHTVKISKMSQKLALSREEIIGVKPFYIIENRTKDFGMNWLQDDIWHETKV